MKKIFSNVISIFLAYILIRMHLTYLYYDIKVECDLARNTFFSCEIKDRK